MITYQLIDNDRKLHATERMTAKQAANANTLANATDTGLFWLPFTNTARTYANWRQTLDNLRHFHNTAGTNAALNCEAAWLLRNGASTEQLAFFNWVAETWHDVDDIDWGEGTTEAAFDHVTSVDAGKFVAEDETRGLWK